MSFLSFLWILLVGTPVIGVLIIVHELGHFLVAKWCGVGVVKFAIGFGPAIWRRRFGETVYQLGLIPLGGFVRMVGDMPDILTGAEQTDAAVRDEAGQQTGPADRDELECSEMFTDLNRWFIHKGLFARSAIVSAGPLANFLLPLILVSLAALIWGQEDYVNVPRIGNVSAGSPAAAAGILAGDVVRKFGETEITDWEGLAESIHTASADPVQIVVDRQGQVLNLTVKPQLRSLPDLSTGGMQDVYLIGIGPTTEIRNLGLLDSLSFGVLWTVDKTALTYIGLWGMITGRASPRDLAGPLFIFQAAGEEAKKGVMNVLYFVSLLSISLAVLNLLPVPILDGGHLMFFLVESIVGPINLRYKEWAQNIGVLLLISLMVFAIHNDISRDPDSMSGEIRWEAATPTPQP